MIFEGTPEEIVKCQQLLVIAGKNGGVLDDLSMTFLNTMIENANGEKQ